MIGKGHPSKPPKRYRTISHYVTYVAHLPELQRQKATCRLHLLTFCGQGQLKVIKYLSISHLRTHEKSHFFFSIQISF